MAIRQVVTNAGEPVDRGDDRVIIGTADRAEAPYPTGYSPGAVCIEIVDDDAE
jgi:hypothetical protein